MYGSVYCFKCRDYVYDCSLDEISRSIEQQLAHTRFLTSRQPVAYVSWEPTQDEIDLLKQNPQRRKLEPGSTLGSCVWCIYVQCCAYMCSVAVDNPGIICGCPMSVSS